MASRPYSATRPLPAVSGYASRFVDDEPEGEYEEPVTSPVNSQTFASYVLRSHAEARVRAREQGTWMWKTAIGSIFWAAMSFVLHGWWSTAALIASCLLGLKWCEHFHQYRCARIISTLWPDV